jgi:hypothetical protein
LSVVGLWEKPEDAEQGWYVPIAEVEQTIISFARDTRFDVREIVFDPARWNRTFMVLDEEGLPFSPTQQRRANGSCNTKNSTKSSSINRSLTMGMNALLAISPNCVTKQSSRGVMVAKAGLVGRWMPPLLQSLVMTEPPNPRHQKPPPPRCFSIQV